MLQESEIALKHGRRKRIRTGQFIHAVTNDMIAAAETANTAIVFEDIAGIRCRLFRKGDGKGKRTGDTVNGVAWAGEIERQITCMTAWEGIPVIVLPEKETMGTSSRHWRCAERSNSVRWTACVPVADSA